MFLDMFYSFLIIIIIVVIFMFVQVWFVYQEDCPDLLIQKGKYIYLMNRRRESKVLMNFNDKWVPEPIS